MFSLRRWPEAFDHCKSAAGTNHKMLEHPSKNDVCFSVPAAVRRGIVYSSVSGCGERGPKAALLHRCDDFQQKNCEVGVLLGSCSKLQKPASFNRGF